MRSAAVPPKEPRKPHFVDVLWLLFLCGVSLALLHSLTGCNPRVIERVQRDTLWRERVQVDSIYKRDSVYIRELGDTIYIYKERIRDRYIYKRDTISRVVRDSVAVERIKEVEIIKPLSWAERLKIRAFWWLLVAVLLLGAWTFRKPLLKLLHI